MPPRPSAAAAVRHHTTSAPNATTMRISAHVIGSSLPRQRMHRRQLRPRPLYTHLLGSLKTSNRTPRYRGGARPRYLRSLAGPEGGEMPSRLGVSLGTKL